MDHRPDHLLSLLIEAINALSEGGDPSRQLDADIDLEVAGYSPISGSYRGIAQVAEIFGATLARRISRLRIDLADMVLDDDWLAVRLSVRGESRTGIQIGGAAGMDCSAVLHRAGDRFDRIVLLIDTLQAQTCLFGRGPAMRDTDISGVSENG